MSRRPVSEEPSGGGAAFTIMDWFKEIIDRTGSTTSTSDPDGIPGVIIEPDGTVVSYGDRSTYYYAKVIISFMEPTGLNGSTDVGTIWQNTSVTPNTYSWWDGYVFRAVVPSQPRYRGGIGLEAYGPAVIAQGQLSIDIYLQAAAPATSINRLWKNSTTLVISRWNGSVWTAIDSVLAVAVNAAIAQADMTDSFLRVFYQAASPGAQTNPTGVGNLWYDSDDNFKSWKWDGLGWVTYAGDVRVIPNDSDGIPPTYSPIPVVSTGLKSFFIEWAAVPNADPVTYRLYMGSSSPVAATLPNMLIETQGLFAWTDHDPNGTVLADGAIRYFSLVAFDANGAATVSATSAAVTVTSAVDPATLAALQAELDASQVDIINRPRVMFQIAQPTGLTTDDRVTWYDTDNGYAASYWNGTAWGPYLLGGSAIAADTIVAGNIAANAIRAVELATDSVITAKIQALAITAGKIAVDTITANEIATNAISANEIAANAVIAGKVAANAIVAGNIAAGAVTAGTIVATAIDGMTITGATLQTGSSGKRLRISTLSGDHRLDFYDNFGSLNSFMTVDGGTSDIILQSTAGIYVNAGARGLVVSGGRILANAGTYSTWINCESDLNATYGGTLNAGITLTRTSIAGHPMVGYGVINRCLMIAGDGLYATEWSGAIGVAYYGGAFTIWSDINSKSNLVEVAGAIDILKATPVYDYDTDHGGVLDPDTGEVLVKNHTRGIIAQDLQTVAPHLVHDDSAANGGAGFGLGVDLYGLIATTIAAIQELDKKVEIIKAKVL